MSRVIPRADRVTINREFVSIDSFIQEYVVNISSTGVFIKSHDPFPVGTEVNLRFTVVMKELEVIEGVGQVVRVSQRPKGMGVVFNKLTQYSQNLLNKLIVPSGDPDEVTATVRRRKP